MRYFAELAYKGTNYFGWQRQPNQVSVQSTIEDAFSTILNTSIEIVGCGRTDTGVHAKQYFVHYDFEGAYPKEFVRRVNKFLPEDIVIYRIFEVDPEAHARFDAYHRAYEYHIEGCKNPFAKDIAYYYPLYNQLDLDKLQGAATLLLDYEEFFPFCKTNHDAKTMRCLLHRSEWIIDTDNQKLTYHIAANRFLRGMVRLIVGMCLNVARGKIDIAQVKEVLDQQTRLNLSHSISADGLYLTDVRYPFLEMTTKA